MAIVVVATMLPVQRRNIDRLPLHHPIIASKNCSNRCQEDCQAGHEAQQASSTVDDFLWNHYPATDDGRDDHSTTNIDILREEIDHVVRAGDDVGGQVGTDLSDAPAKADEEGAAPATRSVPLRRERDWFPDVGAIDDSSSRCADNTEHSEDDANHREEEGLLVYALRTLHVPCKIRNVHGHRGPASSDTAHAGENQPLRHC